MAVRVCLTTPRKPEGEARSRKSEGAGARLAVPLTNRWPRRGSVMRWLDGAAAVSVYLRQAGWWAAPAPGQEPESVSALGRASVRGQKAAKRRTTAARPAMATARRKKGAPK